MSVFEKNVICAGRLAGFVNFALKGINVVKILNFVRNTVLLR